MVEQFQDRRRPSALAKVAVSVASTLTVAIIVTAFAAYSSLTELRLIASTSERRLTLAEKNITKHDELMTQYAIESARRWEILQTVMGDMTDIKRDHLFILRNMQLAPDMGIGDK